jgi:hypothetical protein
LNVGWVEINFPLLRDALQQHKTTLTSISLNTAKHFDSWPERENGLVPPFGPSLKEFEVLKKLDVPASCIIGWDEHNVGGYSVLRDVLPPNIEELKINEFAPRLTELIDGFVAVCAGYFPKLKKLTISRKFAGDIDVEDNFHAKFAEFASDVELSFIDNDDIDHFEESMSNSPR